MAHLIDKDALVAEIERRIKCITKEYQESQQPEFFLLGKINGLENILPFLDTLEVKEVDLDKEIDNFYGMYRKNGITFLIEDNQECLDWKVDCNPDFEKEFAKHFFELGLKAQQ